MLRLKRDLLDFGFVVPIFFLIAVSIFALNSFAKNLFPLYYFYVVVSLLSFFIFRKIDFEILSLFSRQLYVICIVSLVVTIITGQITRGAIRWIEIGSLKIQPSEIVRPFLILFFAKYLSDQAISLKKVVGGFFLAFIPVFLIFIQPSLTVSLLTFISFLGVLLDSRINKKYLLAIFLAIFLTILLGYRFLAPYQRDRVTSFLNPYLDPLGAGYNSIQSMISVGSGGIMGRGFGKGVQTQLAFLPERHNDFVFASISEEFGFLGASLVIILSLLLFLKIIKYLQAAKGQLAFNFMFGCFFVLFTQFSINVLMNLGLFPVAGVTFPLLSSGGSSLVATMIMFGMIASLSKATG